MQVRTFVMALGVGLAAGAAAAAVLPKQPRVKKVVTQAADSIETAVEDAKDFMCGN